LPIEEVRAVACELARRDVRRVADDEVDGAFEAFSLERPKEVALMNLDAPFEADARHVPPCERDARVCQIARPNMNRWVFMSDRAGEVACATAHVDDLR
jgi:hypothetical protein